MLDYFYIVFAAIFAAGAIAICMRADKRDRRLMESMTDKEREAFIKKRADEMWAIR